jgi:predicted nucleotidyltransferase
VVHLVDLAHPLAVVTPTADGDVLAALARVHGTMSARQVTSVVGRYSERGVRDVLARLVHQGIVTRQPAGAKSALYALNRNHLAAEYIEGLAGLRTKLLQLITATMQKWATPPVYAALFGSAARGAMTTDSDLDLFVVRRDSVDPDDGPWLDQMSSLAREVTAWTGNDTRPFELSDKEVHKAVKARASVIEDIANDGIVLYGDSRFLHTMLQRSVGKRRA